jgi:hypothetical protein
MHEKSKFPIWAWIGLGCAGLFLLGVMALFAGGLFVKNKVTEMVETVEANPARALAEVIALSDPNLEVVASDDDAKTVTMRNNETGEELTVDVKALQEGRLEWSTGDGHAGTLSVDPDEGLKVETDEGTVRIGASAGDAPAWVPIPSGVEAQSNFSAQSDSGQSGILSFETTESVDDIAAFYRQALESQGFTLEINNSLSTPQGKQVILGGKSGDESDPRTIHLVVASGDSTTVQIQFQEGTEN